MNLKLNQTIKPWLKIGTSTNFSMANSDMIKTATSNQNNGDEGVIRSALYYPPLYKIEEQPDTRSTSSYPTRWTIRRP